MGLDPEEMRRLEALRGYRILDTEPDPRFDAITQGVVTALDAPIALVTLVDEHRQWFKSRVGLELPETARDIAFCATTIERDEPLLIADAAADPRFSHNPLVTGTPHIRAYAGAPIIAPSGHRIGSVAAIDIRTRSFTQTQSRMLQLLARLAGDELELWRRIALDREHSADDRRELERRWLTLIEHAPDLLLLFDRSGTITYASPSSRSILGRPASELVGTSAFAIAHPDEVESSRAAMVHALAEPERPFAMERRLLHRDGSYRILTGFVQNLLENPAVSAIVVNARDVTEHRAAEEQRDRRAAEQAVLARLAVAALEQRGELDALSACAADLVAPMLSAERVAVWECNGIPPAFCLRAEHRVADSRRAPADDADQASILADALRGADGTSGLGTIAALIGTPAEPLGVMTARLSVARTASHDELEFLRSVANVLAVTFRENRVRAELGTVAERLRHAEKMEALGLLAGGIAHDFNNLLTVILSSIDLARVELPGDSGPSTELAHAKEAAERAAGLTKKILAFGRRQALEPVRMDLNAAVASMLALVRRVLGGRCEAVFEPAPAAAFVDADPTHLEQIVINLCINARDAMPGGGRITVTIAVEEDVQPRVVLAISDEGEGMTAAVRDRMFEPFFTTKEARGGTGLGLATVHGLVAQHNGTIEVASTPGGGTTFKVKLPRAKGEGRARSSSTPQPRPGAGTILVADDEEGIRATTEQILRRGGYEVLVAADGDIALEVYRKHRGRISLAIIDVVMPGTGGPAVVEAILEDDPRLPIVLSSGYPGTAVDLPKRVRWLAKPYDASTLLTAIAELLGQQ